MATLVDLAVSRDCTGKASGDRLSWCVRDLASVAARKGVSTAATAFCQALVELDKMLATVESTSLKYSADDQFNALVSLFDVVARGVLLCLEGTTSTSSGAGRRGRHDSSLETLRDLVLKAREVAARLSAKGRLGLLSRKKHVHVHLQRDLEAVSDAVYRFAASHKPELATAEHHYERKRLAFLASKIAIPAKAPQIRPWYVPRQDLVQQACHRLGVYSAEAGSAAESTAPAVVANGDSGGGGQTMKKDKQESPPPPPPPPPPPVVGLGGPAGCGKSTVAAMVIAREDVRGYFHEGVVWLPVGGRGAKHRVPELMARLASLIHEADLKRGGIESSMPPPPRKACIAADRQDNVAFIRAVLRPPGPAGGSGSGSERQLGGVNGRGRRYLIVADDVYEPEVLEELKGVGACVLYTTTRSAGGMRLGDGDGDGGGGGGGGGGGEDTELLRLDDLQEEEAETVLRRAAGLPYAALPQQAHDMIESYGSVVMDINYVGRWGVVSGQADEEAWDMALNRVFIEAGDGGERWTRRRWHTAVLFAGLADLGRLNEKAKDLYLYLAVLPKGLSFSAQDATTLLFDKQDDSDGNAADLESTVELLVLLERNSVLALEEGGAYRLHGSHAIFVRERISCFPLSRKRALSRWRRHVSTAAALFAWPVEDLVDIWCNIAELASPEEVVERPYDAVLAGLERPHSDDGDGASKLSTVLERIARFHALAGDLGEAQAKYSRLVELSDSKLRGTTSNGGGDGDGGAGGVGDKLALADHLQSLGYVCAELGKADQAEAAHARARSIREQSLGPHHPEVGRSLRALAACAAAVGKSEAEQRLLQQALSIWDGHRKLHPSGGEKGGGTRAGGDDDGAIARGVHQHQLHLDAARALQALGGYAIQQGRSGEAERLLRRAVASWEAALGGDHPTTARALHSLGVCAYDDGKIGDARELYRRALKIRQQKLGPRHLEVASTMHNLGVCEWKSGRVEEAQLLYRTTLAIRVEELGPDHLHVARTLHSLGGCARHVGRSGEATALYRKALDIREAGLGPRHPEVAATLHEMGVTAFGASQMAQAEGYFRRALAIKDSGAKDPSLDTAYTLHDLGGVVLASGGRTAEAEVLFLRALEIRERLGASLDAASTLHCLGECAMERSGGGCHRTGDRGEGEESGDRSVDRSLRRSALQEAEGFYRRALEIQQEELGQTHLYVAHTLFQLGRCLCSSAAAGASDTICNTDTEMDTTGDTVAHADASSRKSEEALGVLSRSLAVREKELGRNHEDVRRTLHHLGACASAAGRVEEAEGWYRRVVASEELTLGADHPAVARTLHQLGACVLKAGKVDEGVGLLRRSLAIPEETAGEGGGGGGGGGSVDGGSVSGSVSGSKTHSTGHHLDVALTLQQLAVCASDAGRVDEADALFRSVLAIEERKLGPGHPDVADTLSNLGECALNAGRTEEATSFYKRALKIEEDNFGDDQPVLGCTLHSLGLCAEQAGRSDEAEELFRRSLAIEEKQMGADHPHVAATLANLGATNLASGRIEEAEGLLTRALSITYKTRDNNTAVVAASTLHSLAECACRSARIHEAEGLLKRALAIEEIAHPPRAVADTLTQLAGWACDGARWEDAEGWYRRALNLMEDALGEGHQDLAGALSRLGRCLSQQEKVDEAAGVHRRALEIVEETVGDRSLEVTSILLDIGLCALTRGRMEEAEVLYRRALAIESEHLGADHPDTQATGRALGLFAPSD
eukprot:g8871.t1